MGDRSPRDGFFGCVAIASGLSSRELDYRLTSFEGGHDRTEVGFDPAHHFPPPRVSDPNPDDSRPLLQNPANDEVLILRDGHGSDLRRVSANRIVRRSRKPAMEDVLGRVAAAFRISRASAGGSSSVDEEAQSCAPQHRVIVLAGSKLQDGRDVFGFEIGIVGQDLFPRGASGKQMDNPSREYGGREYTGDHRRCQESL